MPDRSRARTIQLTCRCGSAVTHEHWDVIDEAKRPDLVSALAEGHLDRVRCDACGRTVFVDEPVAAVRTEAATPVVLLLTDHHPDAVTVPSLDNLPVVWAPATAAPYLLERDLDADAAAPDAARVEVERRFGPAAGFIFAEALRHFVVVTDPLSVLSLFEPLTQTNLAGFQAMLDDRPELLSDTFQSSTERIAAAFPEQAAAVRAMGRLMSEAPEDPRAAWESFQDAVARIRDDIAGLTPDQQRLEAAHAAGHHGEVISLGWSLVERCQDVGAFLVEGKVSELLALALAQQPSEDHAEQIEETVRLLSRAIDRSGEDSVARARRLSHLAIAYTQRLRGDHRDNTESAITFLRDAIRELGTANPDTLAGLQTNLAFALTQREVEDPINDLIEAYDLCQSALRWRTPERNANDWAYTQVNLGAVLERLADHGRARPSNAHAAYASVLPYASQIEHQVLATAQTSLARLDRIAGGRVFARRGRQRRMRASRKRLAAQLDALEGAGPVARGRALHELAQIDLDLGDRAAAIAHLEEAARLLRPEISPSDCARVTTTLASLLAEDGEWTRAAAAFVDAVTATNLRFYERTTAAGRESEAPARGNLSRWASYAIAQAGAEATSDLLRRHAANATYLHLACHAFGATFDFRDAHLKLADGDLPLTELSRIGPLTSRLAVASACQTAVPDVTLSDEAYSVAAILIAAGATGAIASLWPVDDLATALLMIRLYDELHGEGPTPSRALRRAQTWLRDLERVEAEAIIAGNEALATEAARLAGIGENILPDGIRPFADPSYWAAFIAIGI